MPRVMGTLGSRVDLRSDETSLTKSQHNFEREGNCQQLGFRTFLPRPLWSTVSYQPGAATAAFSLGISHKATSTVPEPWVRQSMSWLCGRDSMRENPRVITYLASRPDSSSSLLMGDISFWGDLALTSGHRNLMSQPMRGRGRGKL